VSGEDSSALAAEHAALRRVAALVGRGGSPEEVFAGVLEEVGALLGAWVSNCASSVRRD
jgi:hypothetical protein